MSTTLQQREEAIQAAIEAHLSNPTFKKYTKSGTLIKMGGSGDVKQSAQKRFFHCADFTLIYREGESVPKQLGAIPLDGKTFVKAVPSDKKDSSSTSSFMVSHPSVKKNKPYRLLAASDEEGIEWVSFLAARCILFQQKGSASKTHLATSDETDAPPEATMFSGATGFVLFCKATADGKLLISGGMEKHGPLSVWCSQSGQRIGTLLCSNIAAGTVCALATSQTLGSPLVACANLDKKVYLHDVFNMKLLTKVPVPSPDGMDAGAVHSLAFTHCGTRLVGGSSRGDIFLWSVTSVGPMELLGSSLIHDAHITSLSMLPHPPAALGLGEDCGELVVSGSWDKTVRLTAINGIAQAAGSVVTLDGHTNSVQCVAVSPCGQWVASGCSAGSIRLWDVGAMKSIGMLVTGTRQASDLSFSLCGKFILAATKEPGNLLVLVAPGMEHAKAGELLSTTTLAPKHFVHSVSVVPHVVELSSPIMCGASPKMKTTTFEEDNDDPATLTHATSCGWVDPQQRVAVGFGEKFLCSLPLETSSGKILCKPNVGKDGNCHVM